jgi:integrase
MARTRDRASAEGLLPRMEARPRKDGKVTYRFHPVGGKPLNLGTDKVAACRKVLDLTGQRDTFGTLEWVWERFTDEQKPAKRWAKMVDGTQADYRLAWKQIAKTFGKMQASQIDQTMVAQYVHVERAESPRRADIEKSLLSLLFGHGILLGVCTVNAAKDVQPHGSEPRTEAPDETVLRRFLEWLDRQTTQRRIVGMAAEYASLAGSRKVEFLPLTWPQVDRDAGRIRTIRAKQRGKRREQVVELVEITPRLAALLDRLQAVRKKDCMAVFPTRGGNAYTARGFKTLWQRCVIAAISEKALPAAARFTFHDLRAYYATKHKDERGTLPDLHKNPETTARVYDRNKIVKRSAL